VQGVELVVLVNYNLTACGDDDLEHFILCQHFPRPYFFGLNDQIKHHNPLYSSA